MTMVATTQHRRKPLPESKIAKYPFQLLPNSVYRVSEHERTLAWQAEFVAASRQFPKLLVVLQKRRQGNVWLAQAIESLEVQSFQNFDVFIVGDDPGVSQSLLGLSSISGQVVHFSQFVDAFSHWDGEYVVLVEDGTLLHPQALFCVAKQLMLKNTDFMFANGVELVADGEASYFIRRADFDPIFAIQANPVGGLAILSNDFLRFAFEETPALKGANPWLFALFAHTKESVIDRLPLGLSLAINEELPPDTELFDIASELLADFNKVFFNVNQVGRVYIDSEIAFEVDVVIPFHNAPELTISCLKALFKQEGRVICKVTLVDNRSSKESRAKLETFIQSVSAEHDVQIIRDEGYFNFARVCNRGAKNGKAPLLLFLNNDVELAVDALGQLCRWTLVRDVGVVGAVLNYPNGETQHSGISFSTVRPENVVLEEHYASLTRIVDAVSFAAALVRREVYEQLGGLDEHLCPNGFGDALFCHRLKQLNMRVLLAAAAKGIHHESTSRGRSVEDLELLELVRAGLSIPDLAPDFVFPHQPMRIPLTKRSKTNTLRRVVATVRRKISRSQVE